MEENCKAPNNKFEVVEPASTGFHKQEMNIPYDIDEYCKELYLVLNSLSDVKTTESCCGHLNAPYLMFFQCTSFKRLAKLYRCVDKNYSDGKWTIELSGSDYNPLYGFLLKSKEPFASFEEMEQSVDDLITNIRYWEQPVFDDYFSRNKNF